MTSANRDTETCPAWVWSYRSDAHVCADRSLFKEYNDLSPEATSQLSYGPHTIAGSGTIELLVKKSPNLSDPGSHSTILLTGVLHVPKFRINLIAHKSDISAWTWASDAQTNDDICDPTKNRLVYFSAKDTSFTIRLGNPSTESAIDSAWRDLSGQDIHTIFWGKTERPCWNSPIVKHVCWVSKGITEYIKEEAVEQAQKPLDIGLDASYERPYSPMEKLWLKINFDSEHRFLQIHGMNPHEIEHRGEGRRMARAMILEGIKRMESDEEVYCRQGSENRPDYSDPECMFSAKEVELINEHWGHSIKLMRALRLDVCNWQDWEIAREFVRSFESRDSAV
ncbi:hypothetical protein F5Y12DRAFT_502624 [Xylaria sp. FL1777]|nr:hypothetical protein F5Y12DRAFT_502624 [Xylaria sp. FL1777]